MTAITVRRHDWRPAIRRLPAGEAVAAIGDVHGQDDLFAALMDAVAEEISAASVATFVQLGDLVDRGPKAIEALARARRGLPGATSVTLMGNHEERLLRATLGGDPEERALWLNFGGDQTIAEAGVDPSRPDWPEAFAAALGRDTLDWLVGLPKSWRVGDILFAHAGIDPARSLAEQDPHTLMWVRRPWLDSPGPYPEGVAVLHGHTPREVVDLTHPHRVNLDTGAFRTGLLSGLVVLGDRMRVVQAAR